MIDNFLAVQGPHVNIREGNLGQWNFVRAPNHDWSAGDAVVNMAGLVGESEAAEGDGARVGGRVAFPIYGYEVSAKRSVRR